MHLALTEPEFTCAAGRPMEADVDLLVVPVFEQDPLSDLPELDLATKGEVSRAVAAGEFRGRPNEVFITPLLEARWRPRRVALVGLGRREAYWTDRLRKAVATIGLAARARRFERLACWVRPGLDTPADVQAAAEGATLAEFDPAPYRTTEPDQGRPPAVHLLLPRPELAVETAATRGRILGQATNLARGLVNEPANLLPPRVFAERSAALASEAGIAVEVLEEAAIARLGMGLLLGVARGSAEPPRLIVLRYEPPEPATGPVLGLVGKGITFDSGGLSLKTADGMERMKDDMAGGAAVVCAMRAIGLLKPPVRVVGVVPATENMPGGRATKPGDILRSAAGKMVEVVNTDAEGRLILADALWYAQQLGATHLVDIATLTGACVVALGKLTTGLFGSPDRWVDLVRRVADRAGDRCWPLPVFEEYAELLRSEMADLVNSASRPGGAITAAMFLKAFVGDRPWAHLDIAGTAWLDEARPYAPKGATGVGVRALAELPFAVTDW
jgi:leucyl aminopeptidase